jgi:hypothetical protein
LINPFLTLLSLLKWKGLIWLPDYLKRDKPDLDKLVADGREIHIIVAVVDHFEPSRKEGQKGVQKVREWCRQYESLVAKHHDSDGEFPKHTWFYRYDYPNYECIKILSESVFRGYGEIEFHLHHGNDTPESFEMTLREGVNWFNRAGAMIAAGDPIQKEFAYIAGNWALDNSRRDPALSGVNTELEILRKAGCYADFTFPAFGTNAQPAKVNSIFYAADTPAPKSYDTGADMIAGGEASGDLLIFQGPLHVDWKKRKIEYAALESFAPYSSDRIDYWLQAGIHVKGRPNWIFVKLHTHGMQSSRTFLSSQLDDLHSDLEYRFKSRPHRLHYVTAREAYNIAKAAEAGLDGNPNRFRNYMVKQPINKRMYCNQPYRLKEYSNQRLRMEIENSQNSNTEIRFNDLPLSAIKGGAISRLEILYSDDVLEKITVEGEGKCTLLCNAPDSGTQVEKRLNIPGVYLTEGDISQ